MFRVLIGEGKGPLALTTRLVYSPHAERLLPILFERYRKNWRVRFAIITRLVRFWRCDVLDEGSLEFFELDSLIPDLTARERALIDSQC